MNELSLEERTIGFFLKTKDNVTCYGPYNSSWATPFFSQKEDYDLLQTVGCGVELEDPVYYQRFDLMGLVERNPFLGIPGEQAHAIHFLLQATVEKGQYSLAEGLVAYPDYNLLGGYSFFLELGERLGVQEKMKNSFHRSVDKWEKMFKRWEAKGEESSGHYVAQVNLEQTIPSCRSQIQSPHKYFNFSQATLLNIFAKLSSDSLRHYVQKYGMIPLSTPYPSQYLEEA